MTAPVLVVGAGPVGLTMAYELTRRGVPVRLVDAAAAPATTSRAIATHPRTLETYDQMGLIDEILPRGRRLEGFTLYQNGRRLARFDADYTDMPTRYPFTLCIDQIVTEEVLRDALGRAGVPVEWGVRLTGLQVGPDAVTAELSTGTVTVPYLVGCDGGHSTVRTLLGLPLIGDENQTWLLADGQVEIDLPRDSLYWIRAEGGTMMAVPFLEPGRWRLLDTVDVDFDGDYDRIAERFARKLTRGIGSPVRVARPIWISVFTAQQRLVPRMHDGRAFVCGDAAHVHSPASGQGMNTGIQEAYNLAWKLAMVVHGQAGDELLDSYDAERVPVGEQLLESTKKATGLIELRNPVVERLLPVAFKVVTTVTPIRRRMQAEMLGGMSGLLLEYPDSPLTTGAADTTTGPRPGERVNQAAAQGDPGWDALLEELRDPRWTLLLHDGGIAGAPAAARHAGWLSVRTVGGDLADPSGVVGSALGLGPDGWLLVRPDGYVSARGTGSGFEAAIAALPLRPPVPSQS